MVKPTILLVLVLGVIFAQMIPAQSSDSDNSDAESSDEAENSDGEETDAESPALTCLLFKNLGCNTECSLTAGAFSIKGTGKCDKKNLCHCELDQDDSLEDLFRAKFDADDALKKIKKDDKIATKVLEILEKPFQTAEHAKKELKKVVDSEIYDKLKVDDKTPAWKSGLVDKADKLDKDKIKEYVEKKLKPVLKSSSKQLTKIDYKSNMKKSLKSETGEDLQSIINEVRRTKNKKLTNIVDDYLKSAKTKEKKNTEKDDIVDAIGYQIIDQFVNHIEENAEEKSPIKPSTTKPGKKSKTSDKKSSTTKKTESSKKSSGKKDSDKKKSNASGSRFELPDFDKNFLEDYGNNSMSESFETKKYSLNYQKSSGGSIHFTWKKGNDAVEMSISSGGSISQNWQLGDAKIKLDLSSGGSTSQNWDFGKTKYTYSKSSGGSMSRQWANGKREPETLKKYQKLMDEWCDKNDFLLVNEKKHCTIY